MFCHKNGGMLKNGARKSGTKCDDSHKASISAKESNIIGIVEGPSNQVELTTLGFLQLTVIPTVIRIRAR